MLRTNKSAKFDADTLLKNTLHATLIIAYMLLTFTLIVAVIALPFDDPSATFIPPQWLWPLTRRFFLFDAFMGILFGPTIGITLIAALVVFTTTPRVSRWLRVGINDLIYGQHDDAFALISQVNPHISGMSFPHTILPTIVATIAQTLKLPYVELEAQSDDKPIVNTFGTLPKAAMIERIPLLYHDTKIGELRVAARRWDESLSQSDLTVLRDLARQVGIALYAAQSTADLQRARIRLVTAREEERRRIRRDLHDGLGPMLANFAMQLEQARENLPPAATESDLILARLTTLAQTTITDVRRLVYDLRPPDLDEFGLLSALREYLHRNQTKSTTLRLAESPALPTLPAAAEVAAYRIVQEAINNALKHAHASEVTITLIIGTGFDDGGFDDGGFDRTSERHLYHQQTLRIEISDNGIGIPADHPADHPSGHNIGIGLHSMRERAEELGGNCTITSNADGTHVVAYLPIDTQEH